MLTTTTERDWWLTTDQDVSLLAMYARHYSRPSYPRRNRRIWQCMGPGEKVALRTWSCDAIFGWRRFLDDCIDARTNERQRGINCAFFRNESGHTSSALVQQADAIADALWADRRHYTYVDPTRLASALPGSCFLAAGWRYVRIHGHRARTQKGLLILERITHGARADTTTSPCG
jgi:hypothetical protein